MPIIPKFKKDPKSLTKLERQREITRLRGETEELLDEMGQSSETRAKSTVQKYVKELEEEELKIRQMELDKLKLLSSNKQMYQRFLLVILERCLRQENINKKWEIFAESNDEGIVVGIQKTNRTAAFKVCGIPFYDANACKILAVQIGNTVAKLEGNVSTTDAGIVLPDIEDKKRYGRRRN